MKILLADDHPLFSEGVRHVLTQLAARVEILEASDYPGALALAAQHPDMDLALLDLSMPGMGPLDGVHQFRQKFPEIPLVILSASESRSDMQRVLDWGAMGFIQKSSAPQVILRALRTVLGGAIYVPPILAEQGGTGGWGETLPSVSQTALPLTSRQMDVLRLLLKGMPNKVIASRLDLTEGTVKIHVAAIFRALSVRNRTEAVVACQKLGVTDPVAIGG
jgi:DNA-binding NarL/FixJ family response regulator